MKTFAITIIFTLLILNHSVGQSLRSSRSDLYKMNSLKNGIPKQIIATNTFHNSSVQENSKEILTYSPNQDTIFKKRFVGQELKSELMFVFNSNKKLIYRTMKSQIPLLGWQLETHTYKHDSTGLIEEKHLDTQGNIIRTVKYTYDEKGNPISMKIYNANNRLFGFETADYDYVNGTWIYRIFDNTGFVVSEKEYVLKPDRQEDEKYNKQGDVILYARNWNEKDNVYYLVEYEYDEQGNWIEKRIYRTKKVKDKFKGKKLDRKFLRGIIYREDH